MKRALVFMLSTSLSQGCTPAMRQYAGAGMIVVGAGTTLVATHLLAPCLAENTASVGQPCSDGAHTAPSNSKTGVPLLVGGLSLIVAGGMVLAGNIAGHASAVSSVATSPTPAPDLETVTPLELSDTLPANSDDPTPFPFDVESACALAQRYLERPLPLASGALIGFRVVSCRGPIQVSKGNAALVDVYLRADSTAEQEKVNVCFEHHADWSITSVGTASCGGIFNR
ncbi:MAG TPA: hypothetical protein VHW01_08005 [Polyangiaceae bacterium]|jgi:hypothetical protein|nr:hypothetical protein [Polyangiaceae bacterium]